MILRTAYDDALKSGHVRNPLFEFTRLLVCLTINTICKLISSVYSLYRLVLTEYIEFSVV